MMKTITFSLSVLTLFCVFAPSTRAQTGPPVLRPASGSPLAFEQKQTSTPNESASEVGEDDVVRVSTSLISVPAQVMDRNGRYIGDLRKEDFRIYDNGIEQEVAYFGSVDKPFTVALLLDVSGSTQAQLQAIRAAANAFISRLRPADQLLIVSFDGK